VNAKILMASSSVILALGGLAALFAPHELGAALGSPVAGSGIAIQLLGGAYIASALTNWTAKDKPIGGIYSRPLSIGNFVHFIVGTLVLLNRALDGEASAVLIAAVVVYAVFTLAFGRLAFAGGAPVKVGAER